MYDDAGLGMMNHTHGTDAFAWAGAINPFTGMGPDMTIDQTDTGAVLADKNAKQAGYIQFYTRKWKLDTADPDEPEPSDLSWYAYNLPQDGRRIIFSPRLSENDDEHETPTFEKDDILVFSVAAIGDETPDTRPTAAASISAPRPFDGINSTIGNVRNVYVRVMKVLDGSFTQHADIAFNEDLDAVKSRRAYELVSIHKTQNGKFVDLRPLLCSHLFGAPVHVPYKHYRAEFLSDQSTGGNPAQTDAFKGPGYLAFRITNEQKMDEPDFDANNWDIARIRETQPKSVKIKTVGWNDRRVHKTRLSWTLQSQKKFRPEGFTKRRRILPDHHHDVLNGDGTARMHSLYTDAVHFGGVGAYHASDQQGSTGIVDSLNQTTASNDTVTPYHTHELLPSTVSGPHMDPVPDARSDMEKLSDLYSGRSAYGLPLEGHKEVEYEYYNPAVGQCDLMANRDFPLEERPRFFMQYMRAHTDDAFDAKQELLQPPPIRVKVTARYRIAFMKTSEKSEDKSYGGLPDSMDYDGASDPHIRQNPCGKFVTSTLADGTVSLKKASKQQTVAGQEGDGYDDLGVRMTDTQIEQNAPQANIATLTALASKAGIRILTYTRGDLICETDHGWMLLPTIRTMSSFDTSFVHAQMGEYYKLAWKRIKNRVLNNIGATIDDRNTYSTFETLFSPDRVASGISLRNFARAGLNIDLEAHKLFLAWVQAKAPQKDHRLFTGGTATDPAGDTTEQVSEPSHTPNAGKKPKSDNVGTTSLIKKKDGNFFTPPGGTLRKLEETFDDVSDTLCERIAPGKGREECAKVAYQSLKDNTDSVLEAARQATRVAGWGAAALSTGSSALLTEEAQLNADSNMNTG